MKNEYLKLISGDKEIVIGDTDGAGTIAKAKDTFCHNIDRYFVTYGTDVKGQPTKETPVQVFVGIKKAAITQVFGGFGENLDRLCLSQNQIIRFVEDYSKWLSVDSQTSFLIKENGEFFVVYVDQYMSKFAAYVERLSREDACCYVNRTLFVVPQL